MYILLVISLIVVAVLISSYLAPVKEDEVSPELANNNENKNLGGNSTKSSLGEGDDKFRDFLLVAKTLSPEIELEFLLTYYFDDKKLSEENRKIINRQIFVFATNNSYFFVRKLVLIILEGEGLTKIDKIDFFNTTIVETGFPSVIGLSKVYLEYIDNEDIKEKLIFILEKINRISIIKFIEFVEDDLKDEDIDKFSKNKEYLLNFLEDK